VRREKYKTFFNPSGFVEQHFIGIQTPESVIAAVDELVKRAKNLKDKGQQAMILVCVEEVPKIDISGKMAGARKQAVAAMRSAEYDRIAIYGNTAVQILVNTLVLISGKRDKIRVFDNRVDALRWLKGGA
jgi:hypothetical protein